MPLPQAEQLLALSLPENVPAQHSAHAEAPAPGAKLPAVHGRHRSRPVTALAAVLYVPVGHGVQWEAPALDVLPAAQEPQEPDASGAKVPAGQVWQDAADDA